MKNKIILIFTIFLLLINLSLYSNSATNEFEQQTNKQPTTGGETQTTKNNNVSKMNITSQIQSISNTGNQKYQAAGENKHNWYDKLIDFTITDFLMVIFNALLAFFSYRLWKTTRNLWRVSKEQADALKESVSVTKDIAYATERSANAAQKAAEALPTIERAYVFVNMSGGVSVMLIGKSNGEDMHTFSLPIHLINKGKTPAILSKIYMGIIITRGKPTIDSTKHIIKEIPFNLMRGNTDKREIQAGEEWQANIWIGGINNDDFLKSQNVENQSIDPFHLYCVGKVEYRDVMKESHVTWFCWEYSSYGGYFYRTDNDELNDYT